jgi:uncharacterized protein (UPF0210 family)
VALVAEASETEDYVPLWPLAMDRAAKECGVNFMGGFSALVHKGFTRADMRLIRSIPEALASTERLCAPSTSPPRAPASTWTPWR